MADNPPVTQKTKGKGGPMMSHQQLWLCLSYIHLGNQSAVTGKSTHAMEVTATAHSDTPLNAKGNGLLRL